jgi:thiamine biosynthesis protein ThiS
VQQKGLPAASLVVELNRRIVPQGEWATTSLVAGDRLELLSFVGGG